MLLDVIGYGIILPVLPALLVRLTDESLSVAAIHGGWLSFTYAAIQFVAAPVLGNLSDRFGPPPRSRSSTSSTAAIGASLALAGVVMATSQATMLRIVVPRLGERRAALIGIAVATLGYLGYATATAGWMMYAWLATWFFGAIVMPSTNALLTHRVPRDAQGELQGAVASLFSLSAIVGPPLMTWLFGRFTAPGAPVQVPGAAFFASAGLAAICWVTYRRATRVAAPVSPELSAAP